MEVEVSRCRELRIQSGAFTGGAPLKRVHMSGIYSVVAKRQAFQNLTAPNTHLEVSECNSVVLESHAFKNARGTVSVSISRCKHVAIKPNAFSWLLWINVREVPDLELSSNAFKFEPPQYGRHGPATKVINNSIQKIKTIFFDLNNLNNWFCCSSDNVSKRSRGGIPNCRVLIGNCRGAPRRYMDKGDKEGRLLRDDNLQREHQQCLNIGDRIGRVQRAGAYQQPGICGRKIEDHCQGRAEGGPSEPHHSLLEVLCCTQKFYLKIIKKKNNSINNIILK